MAKKTIYFIDDLVNNALPLLQCGLAYCKSKRIQDVDIHLLAVVPIIEKHFAESECSDFLNKNEDLRGILSYDIIPYNGKKNTFDGNTDEFNAQILKKIKKNQLFSVAIDLMLFHGADTRRLYDYKQQVLSHRLAKKYNGKCALYSSLQGNSIGADFDTWRGLLEEGEVTANFFNIPDHAHVDHKALFDELYILASN